jgi:type II secretory pathway component PulC
VEAFYHPGDMLPGGAGTLVEVFADHVSIEQGGEASDVFLGGSSAQSAAAAAPQNEEYAPVPEDKPKTSYASIEELIVYFQAEPQRVLAQAGLHAVEEYEDKGYRFDGNDTQQVFRGFGLQKDDVILAVNDMAIGDVTNDRFRVSELADKKLLQLKVQRGDKIIGLEYRIP